MAQQHSHSEDSDVDYEKEVLQLGRIWNEIKKSTPEPGAEPAPAPKENDKKNAQSRQASMKPAEAPQKPKPKRQKVPITDSPAARQAPRRKSPNTTDNEQLVRTKPAAAEREGPQLQRNPKQTDPKVITITTNTRQRSTDQVFNHKNDIEQERLVMNPFKRADQKELYEMRCNIEEKNQQISLLRISNNRYHDKIAHLEKEIEKRDDLIAELRNNERHLEKEKFKLYDKEKVWTYGQTEYENFKRDLKRLMEMLKTTTEYRDYANLAIADGGVRFLHQTNRKIKTNIDKPPQSMHFCSCNKAFIPEAALWVPDNVYSYSRKYVSQRRGDLTPAELELMLYDLNKMWRERERTIIDSMNAIKANEIGVYRRKLQNLTKS